MPIVHVQPRLRELVRFRMGTKETSTKGKSYPKALDVWRFTSPSRAALERLAASYGGTVEEWPDESAPGQQWQLTTETAAVRAYIPPTDAFSQWMERWSGGGCLRRCDGERNLLTDTDCDCPVDPEERMELAKDGKACKPVTRLTFVLEELGEVAGARLESHGWNAASELAGVEHLYQLAKVRGTFLPVEVRLAPREKKVPGQATRHFVVPEVAVATSTAFGALAAGPGGALALPSAAAGREEDAAGMPPAQVPNHNDPQDTTPPAGEISDEQLVARFGGLGMDDDEAARLVRFMTGGRSGNLAHLLPAERRGLYEVQNMLHEGTLHFLPSTPLTDGTGTPLAVSVNAEGMLTLTAQGEVPTPETWKQAARSTPGVSLGSLLRQAHAIAGELKLPAPTRVEELQHPELCRRLAAWLEEKAGAAA